MANALQNFVLCETLLRENIEPDQSITRSADLLRSAPAASPLASVTSLAASSANSEAGKEPNWKELLNSLLQNLVLPTPKYNTLPVRFDGRIYWRCNVAGIESQLHKLRKDAEMEAAKLNYQLLIQTINIKTVPGPENIQKNTESVPGPGTGPESEFSKRANDNPKTRLQEVLAKANIPPVKYGRSSILVDGILLWQSYIIGFDKYRSKPRYKAIEAEMECAQLFLNDLERDPRFHS